MVDDEKKKARAVEEKMREQVNDVARAANLTDELQRLRQAERETVAIRARLESHQDEKDRLRQEIRDSKTREDDVAQQLVRCKDELRNDKAKISELDKLILTLKSDLKVAMTDLQRAIDDRDTLDQRLKQETDAIATITEQRRSVADQTAEEVRKLRDEHSHTKLQAMQDVAALKQQLAMSEHERKAAMERLERCEKTCKDNSLVC
jgi:chromosome segregation ATPase